MCKTLPGGCVDKKGCQFCAIAHSAADNGDMVGWCNLTVSNPLLKLVPAVSAIST